MIMAGEFSGHRLVSLARFTGCTVGSGRNGRVEEGHYRRSFVGVKSDFEGSQGYTAGYRDGHHQTGTGPPPTVHRQSPRKTRFAPRVRPYDMPYWPYTRHRASIDREYPVTRPTAIAVPEPIERTRG